MKTQMPREKMIFKKRKMKNDKFCSLKNCNVPQVFSCFSFFVLASFGHKARKKQMKNEKMLKK